MTGSDAHSNFEWDTLDMRMTCSGCGVTLLLFVWDKVSDPDWIPYPTWTWEEFTKRLVDVGFRCDAGGNMCPRCTGIAPEMIDGDMVMFDVTHAGVRIVPLPGQ